jgi:hypothetical protein
MRRGQTTIEFVVMVSFAMVIGVVFLASAWGLFIDTSERERLAAVNDIGYAIQDEMILAATVTEGYARAIVIPEKAGRFTYALSNTPDSVTISSGRTTITYPIPNVTGTFVKGRNIVTNDGKLRVDDA